ncbi:MAG: TatD family hydrolase [Thermoleophilia bacterium]|nr:TatD family hydrolase [Thermoleophilia bacterium]
MIDTHAHLDACGRPPHEVVAGACAAGVERIVTIGTGLSSCRDALAIAEREDGVFAALGIHPHQAGDVLDGDLDELRALLGHPKAVAVGETGLDHFRDYAPRDRQADLFRAQVALAASLEKPLVVHTRAAEPETVEVLGDVDAALPVVLHCFSSSRLLEPALEHDWYVSFAGNVTYPKAAELRWAAARVPAERLLTETDSPYLPPQPVRGRTNEPANLVHTVGALAEARGEDRAGLERQLDDNASRLFALP